MSETDLFAEPPEPSRKNLTSQHAPLAARMRPHTLDEIVGQEHILAEGKLLKRTIQSDRLQSVIFYGPPGTGKTSLARVISRMTKSRFVTLNAVESNVAELRKIIQEAAKIKKFSGQKTIVFIDEIHRFNKAQQDALMPDVENGNVILIGATTHNPAFSINGPLLSRALIFELRSLSESEILEILKKTLTDSEKGFGSLNVLADPSALKHIAVSASGDARRALNALEVAVLTTTPDSRQQIHITDKIAEESCQKRIVYHDKDGDYHYDVASAFIKSIRGSDPDAAVYWLAKMIYAGEDIRFIVRRLLILASEDIGNADPQALILMSAGMQAVEFVGLPEARIILSQMVTYLALAPKSNASYLAISSALKDVESDIVKNVPEHLRDAHYPTAKTMGHGVGYKYAHDYPGHFVDQDYLTGAKAYYQPGDAGFEKELQKRLDHLKSRRSSQS